MADDQPLKMHHLDAPYHLGAFPPEMNMPEPNINAVLYFDTAPKQDAIEHMMQTHLWQSRRFSSKMKGGYWMPREKRMDTHHHFYETTMENSDQIDYFVENRMVEPLDPDYPPWRVFILRNKNGPDAVLFRVSHSVGDGLALLFSSVNVMECEGGATGTDILTKMPLPDSMQPKHARKGTSRPLLKSEGCLAGIKNCFRGCIGPLIVKWDEDLSINAPLKDRQPHLRYSGNRIFHRMPPIPLSLVKTISKKHGCSVNDVIMAAITGAFRKYGADVLGEPKLKETNGKEYECKSMLMMALPRPIDETNPLNSMCNKILFANMPIPIHKASPKERIQEIQKATANLKSKGYMTGLVSLTSCLTGVLPFKVLRQTAGEVWSKASFLVTSVPAPSVPLKWPKEGGAFITEIQLAVVNVMTQISIISYNGYFYCAIVADPKILVQSEKLDDCWTSEFETLEAC